MAWLSSKDVPMQASDDVLKQGFSHILMPSGLLKHCDFSEPI